MEVKSPLNCLSDKDWGKIKKINDVSSYVFSIILDHVETHSNEWNKFLEDDNILI